RPDVRWEYRVHEQVLPSLRRSGAQLRVCDVVIRHVGYQDAALRTRKLGRDLRLLRLEDEERPGDPFTLFNLGQGYRELGRFEEALQALRQSLARSHPDDSITRKLYSLVASCEAARGRPDQALAACAAGLAHFGDDAELLLVRSGLHDRVGDLAAAESDTRRVIAGGGGGGFGSAAGGLRN